MYCKVKTETSASTKLTVRNIFKLKWRFFLIFTIFLTAMTILHVVYAAVAIAGIEEKAIGFFCNTINESKIDYQ